MGRSNVGNFRNFNALMVEIVDKLKQDDDLGKLLLFNDKDPLSHELLNQDEKNDLVYSKIYPIPFLGDMDEEGSFLIITFDKISQSTENPKFKNFIISVDVISHVNLWGTKGGLRPFLLMERVDSILNQNRFSGIGKLQFVDSSLMVLTSEQMGYSLKYYNVEFNY